MLRVISFSMGYTILIELVVLMIEILLVIVLFFLFKTWSLENLANNALLFGLLQRQNIKSLLML
jgi:hypothetical protein